VETLAIACFAALVGACVAVVGTAGLLRVERRGLDEQLLPLRGAIADLEDRVDHVRKRHAKRDRDERREEESQLTFPGSYQERMNALRSRLGMRSAHGTPEKGA